MSIKIALCNDLQMMLDRMQAMIETHPQAALFEVSCFLRADVLLKQSVVYDVLITDIKKDPDDINGLELASQMNEHTKIIILSHYALDDIFEMMSHYYFELFDIIPNLNVKRFHLGLDKYLLWRENPQPYFLLTPKRVPPPPEPPPAPPLPKPKPSITLQTNRMEEVTLYYDEILYLHQAHHFFYAQYIIITTSGEYKIAGYFSKLTQLCKLYQFSTCDKGRYLVNLDYCTIVPMDEIFILTVNKKTVKRFKPSSSEYQLAEHYKLLKNSDWWI